MQMCLGKSWVTPSQLHCSVSEVLGVFSSCYEIDLWSLRFISQLAILISLGSSFQSALCYTDPLFIFQREKLNRQVNETGRSNRESTTLGPKFLNCLPSTWDRRVPTCVPSECYLLCVLISLGLGDLSCREILDFHSVLSSISQPSPQSSEAPTVWWHDAL